MSIPLEISFPRDGDILDRCDGAESPDALLVTVRGTAAPGSSVHVNGKKAACDGETFTCDVALTERRNAIRAEANGQTAVIEVFWNRGSRKRYRFSVDDNILFLKDLGTNPDAYPSLFDHWYLGFWRSLHKKYGTKIHINVYYQTDGFDLTEMPDRWRDEWRANADWLHLSFHALQDKPDRPYRNARYTQLAHDYDLVCGHIRRFAGNETLSRTTTVHWAECPKEAALALRDRGIDQLIGLFEVQGYEGPCTTGYYLSREQCAHCDSRGAWFDRETGLMFIRCTAVVNALEIEEIEPYLNKRTVTPQTAEMVELLIHEQYFRKELALYQPTVFEKVETALRWVVQRGYEPVFWSDGFLGV